MSAPKQTSKSISTVQQEAEKEILSELGKNIDVDFSKHPHPENLSCKLDGFGLDSTNKPVCVEVFAHQGISKPGQKKKIMCDMCKLLLVEKQLGRNCLKVIAVSDCEAVGFLDNSWMGKFADKFGIVIQLVSISDALCVKIKDAQSKQKMVNAS